MIKFSRNFNVLWFLQTELDEKTEKIVAMEQDVERRDEEMEGMQQQIRDLQRKNE